MNNQLMRMTWSFTWRFLLVAGCATLAYVPFVELIKRLVGSNMWIFQITQTVFGIAYIQGLFMLTFRWMINKKIILST